MCGSIGFHLTIERPELVNRVYPPKTIIPKTVPADNKSQEPTIFSLPCLTHYVSE